MSAYDVPEGAPFFLDTNIFVYALLASEPLKQQRALELIERALNTRRGCDREEAFLNT